MSIRGNHLLEYTYTHTFVCFRKVTHPNFRLASPKQCFDIIRTQFQNSITIPLRIFIPTSQITNNQPNQHDKDEHIHIFLQMESKNVLA